MNQIDPNTFLRPATVKASEVKPVRHYVDCGGWLLQVTNCSNDFAKREISATSERYGSDAVSVKLTVPAEALLDVFEYDELAHKREVTAAKLARADGVEDWAGLHEEDRARWLRLVEAISYGGAIVDAPSGRPVQDPSPAAVTGKAARR